MQNTRTKVLRTLGVLAVLAALAAANGLADDPGTSATAWTTDDSVVYRVTATLAADTPADAQGDSTGAHALRWEAQNQ